MDVKKKAAMHGKVNEYIKRAEDLKRIIYAKGDSGAGSQLQSYQKMRRMDDTELSMLNVMFLLSNFLILQGLL
jgi:hypothetical protein